LKPPREVIIAGKLTEKGTKLRTQENKYLFLVEKSSNKLEIKKAVEDLFKVKVKKVTTMNQHGKLKRMGRFEGKRSNWKKAIVQLMPGEAIEVFETV
jgi:large subunit ribosomal protein L23